MVRSEIWATRAFGFMVTSPRIPVIKGSGLHSGAPDMNFFYGHLQEKGAGARCKIWHYSIEYR